MHELSIALNIVEIVTNKALENNAMNVNEIEIEIGDVSGVVHEALETAMQSAVKDTIMENAKIHVHKIKAESKCNICETIFAPLDIISPCPKCQSFDIKIVKGTEISVRSITID